MKRLKKVIRVCSLILFMLLAVGGIGIFGVAPVLTKDRKLFADIEAKAEKYRKGKQRFIKQ
jgi:formate-dependent phosphoribosylglycinamide formyltransferase (GAR transformylase)